MARMELQNLLGKLRTLILCSLILSMNLSLTHQAPAQNQTITSAPTVVTNATTTTSPSTSLTSAGYSSTILSALNLFNPFYWFSSSGNLNSIHGNSTSHTNGTGSSQRGSLLGHERSYRRWDHGPDETNLAATSSNGTMSAGVPEVQEVPIKRTSLQARLLTHENQTINSTTTTTHKPHPVANITATLISTSQQKSGSSYADLFTTTGRPGRSGDQLRGLLNRPGMLRKKVKYYDLPSNSSGTQPQGTQLDTAASATTQTGNTNETQTRSPISATTNLPSPLPLTSSALNQHQKQQQQQQQQQQRKRETRI